MSDLLIKGMKMPKNCGCCPLAVGGGFTFTCMRMIGKEFSYELAEQRQEDCPLVEVSPHGELCDKDKLKEEAGGTYQWKQVIEAIKNAPTILEASK